mmetsp:Transcript_19757/g.52823  ORF Transcript_19757/g.52823 Transcript_19757/m.52823 type:complete len:452 (+) Transcript_19757:2676-4031(+)
MTELRNFWFKCLSWWSSRNLPKRGISLTIRDPHASIISRERFNSMSANARRTRLYSFLKTVVLRCSLSSPVSPARSVMDRARWRKSLFTAIACRRYAPQNFPGSFCDSCFSMLADDASWRLAEHKRSALAEFSAHVLDNDSTGEQCSPCSSLQPPSASGQSRCHVSSRARSNCFIARDKQSNHILFSKRSVPPRGLGRLRTEITASEKNCIARVVPSTCGGRLGSCFARRTAERLASRETRSKSTSLIAESFSSTMFENIASNPSQSLIYHPSSQLPFCCTYGCISASCCQSAMTRNRFCGTCKKRHTWSRTAIRDWNPLSTVADRRRLLLLSSRRSRTLGLAEPEGLLGVTGSELLDSSTPTERRNFLWSCSRSTEGSEERPNSARTVATPPALGVDASDTPKVQSSSSPDFSPVTPLFVDLRLASASPCPCSCKRSQSSFNCLLDTSVW